MAGNAGHFLVSLQVAMQAILLFIILSLIPGVLMWLVFASRLEVCHWAQRYWFLVYEKLSYTCSGFTRRQCHYMWVITQACIDGVQSIYTYSCLCRVNFSHEWRTSIAFLFTHKNKLVNLSHSKKRISISWHAQRALEADHSEVVTVSYRLGALGFLVSEDFHGPGNGGMSLGCRRHEKIRIELNWYGLRNGIRDIATALKWIQRSAKMHSRRNYIQSILLDL